MSFLSKVAVATDKEGMEDRKKADNYANYLINGEFKNE